MAHIKASVDKKKVHHTSGYIADTLKFCGDNNTDGIAKDTICPSFDTSEACPMSAERAFWISASKQFAKNAVGKVTVMLNATAKPIYSPNTYFAFYEAPYLRQGQVTEAKIILVNDQPSSNSAACADPSLTSLFSLLEEKGIKSVCEENPREVLFLYCADNPYSPVCSALVVNKSPPTDHASGYRKLILIMIFMLVVF